ncbi:MAG: energy-coupling factor transporter ATPase [Defluviitaleaceae bacterium]|nr:energy-coupling factor transporter ATPase [Defluviitaleaceae bacterium]
MITAEKLSYTYPPTEPRDAATPPALFGVDLAIAQGAYVAIVGHNGSGKSTLARHMNALLAPTSGTMYIDGKNTADTHLLWEIRKTAGMVFQNPDNQLVATSVEEDVAFGPENLGLPSEEIRTRLNDALAAVGLSDFAQHAPSRLSGGQKQRVAIAGVFAMQPQILILDEPTAMLDPAGRREVMQTIAALNRTGITVVLITHFVEEAATADRIIVMHKGQVTMDGSALEIFAQPQKLVELGLALPTPIALAELLRKHGIAIAPNIITAADLLADTTLQLVITAGQIQNPVGCKLQPTEISAPVRQYAPANTGNALLELRNISHTYNRGTTFEITAIRDVSLTVHTGEILGIIGHTGSGKSTLIQHLNGLLTPTLGQIIPPLDAKTRRNVGLVFQYPEHQLFESTVYRDVAFGPTKMGLQGDALDTAIRHALTLVGLPDDTWERSPFALSGGQKRRAAIAGVLAMQPQILILDEPTAGLDPAGCKEILDLIAAMRHERAIVLVSHSMDEIARLCDSVVVMNHGEIALQGSPREVFAQQKQLENMGLDVPQITHIMSRLAEINPALPTDVLSLTEAANIIAGISEVSS